MESLLAGESFWLQQPLGLSEWTSICYDWLMTSRVNLLLIILNAFMVRNLCAKRLYPFPFKMCENTAQPLQKKEGNWVEFTFAKTCGTVTRDREKNWPIADRYLVTIPETIVGCISAPVPFLFLKWRITVIENSTRENVSAQIKSDCL